MGEIGTVDDNKNIRLCRVHRIRSHTDATPNGWSPLQDRGDAHKRHIADRVEARQAFGRHRAAANARELDRFDACPA